MKTDEPYKVDFKRPPWSGQVVKMWIRVLAWIWVIIVVMIAPFVFWFGFKEGISIEDIPFVLGVAAVEIYMTMLFAHVAFRGRAPIRWFPWDRLTGS
jgi:hypothetical protein